ncbi:uncharacterized protein DS421_11g332120 [Arachis hypogaea]|nr:uncharacterized protein DS421_11g332120 [Arachis hypogaea]
MPVSRSNWEPDRVERCRFPLGFTVLTSQSSSFLFIYLGSERCGHCRLWVVICDNGAGKDVGGGGAAKPTEVPDRSRRDDDRSCASGGLHDVPKQARTFLFFIFQTDVGARF